MIHPTFPLKSIQFLRSNPLVWRSIHVSRGGPYLGRFFFSITVKHYRNYIFLILEDVKQNYLPNYFYKAFNCLILSIAFTKVKKNYRTFS